MEEIVWNMDIEVYGLTPNGWMSRWTNAKWASVSLTANKLNKNILQILAQVQYLPSGHMT